MGLTRVRTYASVAQAFSLENGSDGNLGPDLIVRSSPSKTTPTYSV